jgi:hypothetical protein
LYVECGNRKIRGVDGDALQHIKFTLVSIKNLHSHLSPPSLGAFDTLTMIKNGLEMKKL